MVALDVIRGVALCGIILVNIGPQTAFGDAVGYYPRPSLDDPSGWLQLFVQQRFFPIFALLFGIGFSIFLESARRKAARPRVLLARRLVLLLAVGIPFNYLQPGAALLPFAIFGLLVLLPSTWLPRWLAAVAAVMFIAGSVAFADGGFTLIPGMFLLGSALSRYGVIPAIGRSRRWSLVALLAFTALAIPANLWQASTIENSGFNVESATAGLVTAGAYVALLSLMMTTPASRALTFVFAPLGKMALTNYVTAAPLMLVAGALLGLPQSTSWTHLFAAAGTILVAQWAASTLWLRHFTQGPLEWLWRWGTWGCRQPLRPSENPSPDRSERAETPVRSALSL